MSVRCFSSPRSSSVCSLRLAERSCRGGWMNGRRDTPDYLCRAARSPRLHQTLVLWFLLGMLSLTLCRRFCFCLGLSLCICTPGIHTPVSCVCVCDFCPPGAPLTQHQLLYLWEPMAERHAPYPAHPTPEAANELLLYTLMKYNCIMVCK